MNWNIPDASGIVIISSYTVSIPNYAFANSKTLKTIIFTQPSALRSIGACAFQDCPNLKGILIPNTVENIGDNAFNGCIGLTRISLPSSMKMVGSHAFKGCACLAHIIISRGILSQVPSWDIPADLTPFIRVNTIEQNITIYKTNIDTFDWANGVTISTGIAITFGEEITITSSIIKNWW